MRIRINSRKKLLLTPTDPRWDDFTDRLIRHLHLEENSEHEGYFWDDCDGSFRLCRNIIQDRFPEVDVEATLNYFRQMEWFCDCDVFTNCPFGLGINRTGIPVDKEQLGVEQ